MGAYTVHAILRAYVSKARSENFIALGNENQKEWFLTDKVSDAVQNVWGKTLDEIYTACLIDAPSTLENKLICAELKQKFFIMFSVDPKDIPHFGDDFILQFPRCDFFVPKYNGNLIERFRFYSIKGDEIKEIKTGLTASGS